MGRDAGRLDKRTNFRTDIRGTRSQRFVGEYNVLIVSLLQVLDSGIKV